MVVDEKETGFCCHEKYTLHPRNIRCYHLDCIIGPDEIFFAYDDRIFYCYKCFHRIRSDEVTTKYLDMDQPGKKIAKNKFEKKINDMRCPEPFVTCKECKRMQHAVCELFYELLDPEGFVCAYCRQKRSRNRPENVFTSKNLPTNKLSAHIEERVRMFLQQENSCSESVFIRVLSSTDDIAKIPQHAKIKYAQEGYVMEDLPYRRKGIYAFQIIDNLDVCIFGMYVQEYDSDCPAPNNRKVYISHIDSLNYFRPEALRTALYSEIVLGYLNYVKQQGYISAHITSFPQFKNSENIFNYPLSRQKEPDEKRLCDWYLNIFELGFAKGIILAYDNDIAYKARLPVTKTPYFYGDYFPLLINTAIIEQVKNEIDSRYLEKGIDNLHINEECQNQAEQREKCLNDEMVEYNSTIGRQEIFSEIVTRMVNSLDSEEYYAFSLCLNREESIANFGPITDSDPPIHSILTKDPSSIKTNCNMKLLEFSSLRRAKYSTKILLYLLHNEESDTFQHNCNRCQAIVETRYTCEECRDFNFCMPCNLEGSHDHKMVMRLFNPQMENSFILDEQINQFSSQTIRQRLVVQSELQFHSIYCEDEDCPLDWCPRLRAQFNCCCNLKANGGCPFCKSFMNVIEYHANNCYRSKCSMIYCDEIRLRQILRYNADTIPQFKILEDEKDVIISTVFT